MTLRRHTLATALLIGATLASRAALAQVSDGDKAAARQLTIEGHAANDRKDYAAAADLFARADKLYHAPTVTLGLARAKVGLGKLLTGLELYNRLVHEPLPPNPSEAFVRAIEDGRTELAALTARVPSLIITVRGGDAPRVMLDGAEVPAAVLGVKRPVDPGKHVVRAFARGMLPAEASVTVSESKVETLNVDLVRAPAGTPDPPELLLPAVSPDPIAGAGGAPSTGDNSTGHVRKPIGFAFIGVGAATLVVGAVTGGLAASKRSSLIQQCPAGHCAPSLQPTLQPSVDSLHTLANVSTATVVLGSVFAATGVILVLTAPKGRTSSTSVSPLIGPSFAGLTGSFR